MQVIDIWKHNPKWLNYILCVLAILVISAVRAWSIFNYSIWNVDEEQTVIIALGFLDYDFNPRYFDYNSLLSPIALMEPPMFGLMEPLSGCKLVPQTG